MAKAAFKCTTGTCDTAGTALCEYTFAMDGFVDCQPGDGNACTSESCQSGFCVHTPAAGAVCRLSAGPCDVAETCDGITENCPADAFSVSGTACATDGKACTDNLCDGTGKCTHSVLPDGTTCRPSTGVCDPQETCDGSGDTCPANLFVPSGDACDDRDRGHREKVSLRLYSKAAVGRVGSRLPYPAC